MFKGNDKKMHFYLHKILGKNLDNQADEYFFLTNLD